MCDGELECEDGSDEALDLCGESSILSWINFSFCSNIFFKILPENWTCPDETFSCGFGYPSCISSSRFCDGIRHCSDGSDENNCGKFLGGCEKLI